MEDYRRQFIEIYEKQITRPGADRLLKWLDGTDFSARRLRPNSTGPARRAGDAQHQRLQCDDAALF